MKYKAEDGYLIISEPNKTVEYSCKTSYPDGIYESFETTSDIKEIGIKQIKIKRIVSDGTCKYQITESNNIELQEYLDKIKQDNI